MLHKRLNTYKLNPFVEDYGASATHENAPKGVMPSNRMQSLALQKPLSLDQFVALTLGASRSRHP